MKIDRQKVYEKYEGHCAYCGREIKFKEMQVDHIIPKSELKYHFKVTPPPGHESVYNKIEKKIMSFENLMPSCRLCNHYKRSQSLEEFRITIKTLNERLGKIYIFRVAMNFGIVETKWWDGLFYFEKKMSIKEFVEARQKRIREQRERKEADQ